MTVKWDLTVFDGLITWSDCGGRSHRAYYHLACTYRAWEHGDGVVESIYLLPPPRWNNDMYGRYMDVHTYVLYRFEILTLWVQVIDIILSP